MSIDEHYFSQHNFNIIKSEIIKESKIRYKLDMGDQLDEDILKVMEYVFGKVGSVPPVGTEPSQYIYMINGKVYQLVMNQMHKRLDGNLDDKIKALREERDNVVQNHMQLSNNNEMNGERVIHESSIHEEPVEQVNDDTISRLHAESNIIGEDEFNIERRGGGSGLFNVERRLDRSEVRSDQFNIDDRSDQFNVNDRSGVDDRVVIERPLRMVRYLSIDSRFRDINIDKYSSSFTVRFVQSIDLIYFNCIDVIIPSIYGCNSRHLFLKIDQLSGHYYEDDIFAKLVPSGVIDMYCPSIKDIIPFQSPQRINELTFHLQTSNRSSYEIRDILDISSLERARGGGVQIVLDTPISSNLLHIGDRVSFYQLLHKDTIEIQEQEFTYRMQTESSGWIYGDYGEITPSKGDLVSISDVFYVVSDGIDNGAMLLCGITEELIKGMRTCSYICKSISADADWVSSGIYDHNFYCITKVHLDKKRIDKIEIDYRFSDLSSRDHLGGRMMMCECLQVSATFRMCHTC